MRTCVIGGGLAGVALAWRLAAVPGYTVDLVLGGGDRAGDATGVSAGGVRGYEPAAEARQLATASLRELLDSAVLRRWSGYHECGFTYLRQLGLPGTAEAAAGAEQAAAAVAEIARVVPDSARLASASELLAGGWVLDESVASVAVVERRAGHLVPHQLRRAMVAELAARSSVTVHPGWATVIQPRADGTVLIGLGGDRPGGDRPTLRENPHRTSGDGDHQRVGGGRPAAYDLVVVAAGAWTGELLRSCGLPDERLRAKAIQYAVHLAESWQRTGFVDETTGLYGRPSHDGGLLLGLPTTRWGVPAGRQPLDRQLLERAVAQARHSFPGVQIGQPRSWFSAADCYTDPPGLALRQVPGAGGGLFTFTGGSGGAAKTVLAASARAAGQLAGLPDPLLTYAHPSPVRLTRPPSAARSDPMSDPVPVRDELPHFHTVGVGAGPANLSLAALYGAATNESIALFDRQPGPAWHPTLLYRGVRMQTGWLKDLVSLVDPKHELTFLNYLVSTGRLYAMLNAQFDAIPRIEYQRYLCWAARQLPNVRYGVSIDRISFTDDGFVVCAQGRPLARAEHLVVAVGTRPFVPAELAGLPPEQAFLADDLPQRLAGADPQELAAPVAVVGGGQTGIEAVFRLLGMGFTDIRWFGRQQWFQSIDDSPVANDVYRPAHLAYLRRLSGPTRRRLIADHRVTGDALTPGALKALYQANYDGMLELGRFPVTLLPGREVTAAELAGGGRAAAGEPVDQPAAGELVLRCATAAGPEEYRFRHVVIATGREHVPPPFDEDLWERVDLDEDGEMVVDADFSVRWKGMNGHRIFALNHSRYSHGLTNAGLTLLPVRAAMVLNSLFGRELYKIDDDLCPVRW